MVVGTAAKPEEPNAGIDMEKLKREFDLVTRFIYVLNHTDGTHTSWMDFCEKERGERRTLSSCPNLWRL